MGTSASGTCPVTEAQLQLWLQQAFDCRWLDCLFGRPPALEYEPIPPGDPRVVEYRALRAGTFLQQQDRIGRYWLRDLRHYVLLQLLAGHSAWGAGQVLPIHYRDLTEISGLSSGAVRLVLRDAEAAGDFILHPAESDRRLLTATPSAAIQAAIDCHRANIARAAAALARRQDRSPLLEGQALQAWRRLHLQMSYALASRGVLQQNRRIGNKLFINVLSTLTANGAQRRADIVAKAAERLQVTEQTVRNLLAWLHDNGWVEGSEMLVASAMAHQRFAQLYGLDALRWQRLFDVLDALVAQPALAEAAIACPFTP